MIKNVIKLKRKRNVVDWKTERKRIGIQFKEKQEVRVTGVM